MICALSGLEHLVYYNIIIIFVFATSYIEYLLQQLLNLLTELLLLLLLYVNTVSWYVFALLLLFGFFLHVSVFDISLTYFFTHAMHYAWRAQKLRYSVRNLSFNFDEHLFFFMTKFYFSPKPALFSYSSTSMYQT